MGCAELMLFGLEVGLRLGMGWVVTRLVLGSVVWVMSGLRLRDTEKQRGGGRLGPILSLLLLKRNWVTLYSGLRESRRKRGRR